MPTLLPARLALGALSMSVLLPATQDEVWLYLTQPEALEKWSPVVPDRGLGVAGPAVSQENPGDDPVDATVHEARAPWFLQHAWGPDTLTWQLAPAGDQVQLNLVHELSDQAQAAGTAAGWHLCLVVLGDVLAGLATPRCVGRDALEHGWEEISQQYRRVLDADISEQ